MVRLTLSTRLTLEEQAAARFEASKKARKKLTGVDATIARYERELPASREAAAYSGPRQKAWYERFRWSRTASGVLVIGGRDAGTNETVIKKHLEPRDVVFHTDLPGSPFVLLKPAHGQEVADADREEAAALCAAYSRLWKAGAASGDVFWVLPDQVSKTANTGEFVGRGSFIVRGEKHFLHPSVTIAIGLIDGVPACGAATMFAGRPGLYALLGPGEEKASEMARKLLKKLPGVSDDFVPLIPAGGARLAGWKRGTGEASLPADLTSDTENV